MAYIKTIIAALLLISLAACSGSGSNNGANKNNGSGGETEYSQTTVTETGYITVTDGTRLRYHMERAEDAPPGPVVIQYDGYDAGTGSYFSNIPEVKARLLTLGYTMLGVSVRGTGCSSGSFDLFEPQRAVDGAEAVEWAAIQPWSDGNVGMIGYSYPGIMQLFVAGQQPPHLKAIAPSNVIFDLYRDVGSPGGIPNGAFTALFTAQQQAPGFQGLFAAMEQEDPECFSNYLASRAAYNSFAVDGVQSPHIDGTFGWHERSPMATAAQIDVPVLNINYWQDEQTGSRLGGLLEAGGLLDVLNPETTWTVMSNGHHDVTWSHPLHSEMLVQFYQHYLRGIDNGWESTPRVQLLHELRRSDYSANWITQHDSMPTPEAATLYLNENNELTLAPPTADEASDSYLYPLLSSSTNPLPDMVEDFDRFWQLPTADAGRLVWTTPALAEDLQLLGSASVDLWLNSTAEDADVQVTLTEVRADGQEVYVSRGWLRASKRALISERSTATRPFHDFTEATTQPLSADAADLLRIEIFPFAHRFRAGSALRLIVDGPQAITGDWGALSNPTPAVNTVLRDKVHASKLVLGVINDPQSRPAAIACGELDNQPCRDSIQAVPEGRISIRP